LNSQEPKVALVHDWLTNQGGGERVLWALHKAFPRAPIYTSVFNPEPLTNFADLDIRTSFLQRWPFAKTKHQLYSMLRQVAFESFNFSNYDIVISSCSAEAKGIITKPGTMHVAYIHTPTRYYWSDYTRYLKAPGLGIFDPIAKLILPHLISKIRNWDFAAAARPDYLIANSDNVAKRIEKYYHRTSQVIYPPVQIQNFHITHNPKEFLLVVSRLIPYKRIDLAVEACRDLDIELIVIGVGSELKRLQKLAGPKIKFVVGATDAEVADYYSNAKAFIFPTEEDFGITPLEAMASGRPVIAYGKGGALETVIDGQTGVFFQKQTVPSLIKAIQDFDSNRYNPELIQKHASKFSEERFLQEIQGFIEHQYQNYNEHLTN